MFVMPSLTFLASSLGQLTLTVAEVVTWGLFWGHLQLLESILVGLQFE